MTLTNQGNTSLSAPTVKIGDSYTKQFDHLTLQPGESENVTIDDWTAPTGTAATKIEVEYPVGAEAATTIFTSTLPSPTFGNLDPVAGTPSEIVLTVPSGIDGEIHLRMPDGNVEKLPIRDGKAVLTHTFPTPGLNNLEAVLVDPKGNKGQPVKQPVNVRPAAPTVLVVDPNTGEETTPVAGKQFRIVVPVPTGTTGEVEMKLPNGDVATAPIENGEAEFSHTVASAGEAGPFEFTVISPDGTRGETAKHTVDVAWPSDLSSIAELKPDCKDALITSGVFGGIGLLLALASQVRIEAVEQVITQIQTQMGIYNPQMAQAAKEWGPRLGTALGLIALIAAIGDTAAKCSVPGSSIGGSSIEGSGQNHTEDSATPTDTEEAPETPATP